MIALVFCGDLKYCPYIKRYIERIEALNVDYKVYFWNRGLFQMDLSTKYVCYDSSSDLRKNKIQKAFDFLKFRRWIINQLKRDKPDKMVVLSTLTGVLLSNYLSKMRGKYIFDIRDYSYEKIKIFYSIEKKVIEESAFTAISSKGFQTFLPKHEYIIAHNFNQADVKKSYRFKRGKKPIKIVWNGVIRYFEYQRQYLDALKNDWRFEVVYHGDGPELDMYRQYCSENGFLNVKFTGSYDNSQKEELLADADILNNCYGYITNAGDKLKYAVSNRFYDGIIYHIPQIVEPEGFKSELTKRSGIGMSCEPDSMFADNIYEYYQSLNADFFDKSCNKELESVIEDDNNYMECIDQFIIEERR